MEARVNFSRNQLITIENIQLTLKFLRWDSAFTMRLVPTQRDFCENPPPQTFRNAITDSNLAGLAAFATALIKTCSLSGVASS